MIFSTLMHRLSRIWQGHAQGLTCLSIANCVLHNFCVLIQKLPWGHATDHYQPRQFHCPYRIRGLQESWMLQSQQVGIYLLWTLWLVWSIDYRCIFLPMALQGCSLFWMVLSWEIYWVGIYWVGIYFLQNVWSDHPWRSEIQHICVWSQGPQRCWD